MTREEAKLVLRSWGVPKGREYEAIMTLIPELAESEDEKIKKIITDSVFYQYGAGAEYKDVLDYLDKLEKQKVNTDGDFAHGYDCGYKDCLHSNITEQKEYENKEEASSNPHDFFEFTPIEQTLEYKAGFLAGKKAGERKEYKSNNFDDVWTTEDCAEIIEAGEKLSPRFKEQFKEVCHAWYDKGIEFEKQKERDLDIVPELRPTAWGEGYQHGCKDTEEKYSGMMVCSPEEWNEAISDAFKHGMDEGEKHKEQKPNIELIQKSWYMEGYHDCEFNNEPRWVIKTGEGGPRYEENPKYGSHIEQKPTEWNEDDESCWNLIWDILDGSFTASKEGYKKAAAWFLKNCPKKQKEQKSAEKQDYSGLTELEQAIHRGFLCAGVENVPVNIIKETAQDCLAHLPVEWSEEDEDNIKAIIQVVRGQLGLSECRQEYIVNWLKSLRPSWKFSKEPEEPKYYQHFDPDC